MKYQLKKIKNKGRQCFEATIDRIGSKTNFHGFPEETLLLLDVNIKYTGEIIDHVWIGKTKNTEPLFDIAKSMTDKIKVSFYRKILEYRKCGQIYDGLKLVGEEIDYKIGYITNVEFLNRPC